MAKNGNIALARQLREHLGTAYHLASQLLENLEAVEAGGKPQFKPAADPAKPKKVGRPKKVITPLPRNPDWFLNKRNHLSQNGRIKIKELFDIGYNCSEAAALMSITRNGALPHWREWKSMTD